MNIKKSLLPFWTTISLCLEVHKYTNTVILRSHMYVQIVFRSMIKNLTSSCSMRIYTTVCAILFSRFHDGNITHVYYIPTYAQINTVNLY